MRIADLVEAGIDFEPQTGITVGATLFVALGLLRE